MGKKSKRRAGNSDPAKKAAAGDKNNHVRESLSGETTPTLTGEAGLRQVLAHPDKLIPRQRLLYPEDWDVNKACLHPNYRPEYQFVVVDAELYVDKTSGSEVKHKQKAKQIEHFGDCPMCFQLASQTCARCRTVSYCSKECQSQHWKLSHKKACKANPKLYQMRLNLDKTFRPLTEDCFELHEFLVVKPTPHKLESMQQICDQVLEPADDLFDISGFGSNQMNNQWLQENRSHPVYRQMLRKFGWTSGYIGHEMVCGYRPAEARIMFFCWCDDSFQMEMRQPPSYYGKALFPPLEAGKHVRGKLVVYKILLKNKRRVPRPTSSMPFPFLNLQLTDDADLKFEFVLQPTNKAELAFMLQERCQAMEQGAYTPRMWRYPLRAVERQLELEAVNNDNNTHGMSGLTLGM